MTQRTVILRYLPVTFLFACLCAGACSRMVSPSAVAGSATHLPDGPSNGHTDATQPLKGIWLPESDYLDGSGTLGYIHRSKFTITGQSFTVSNFWGLTEDITGTLTLDSNASPPQIDITNDQIDFTPVGKPIQYPAGTWPGIYELDQNILTVCFQMGSRPQRPGDFHPGFPRMPILSCLRSFSRCRFQGLSQSGYGRGHRPPRSACSRRQVFSFLQHFDHLQNPKWNSPDWRYHDIRTADAHGCTTIPYDDFRVAGVRDTERKLIGFATASPARLQKGNATIRLQPECLLRAALVCGQLTQHGKPLGWSNVQLEQNGWTIAEYDTVSGQYEFPLPPGRYFLRAYGENLNVKRVEINVPAGQSEFQMPPIELTALPLAQLQGQPAPELAGIVAWKGQPVRLADLRGKYVLLDFWGYWCGPCVAEMPVLIDLHEKFAGRGLAIVTVHVDDHGEVDNPAKLEEKIASVKASLWGGRDLPFPTALSAGKNTVDDYDGLTAAQYGVQGFPTTILIDRQGKVVGEFDASDIKSATSQIEKLVAQRP